MWQCQESLYSIFGIVWIALELEEFSPKTCYALVCSISAKLAAETDVWSVVHSLSQARQRPLFFLNLVE